MSATDHSQRGASGVTASRRGVRAAAGMALVAGTLLATAACGSGQISQTASQVAAINGANQQVKDLALRDVHILYPAVGGQARIAFTIANQSPTDSDSLESITSADGTKASISGDTTIAPNKAIYGSAPAGTLDGADIDRLKVSIPVAGQLRPGLTTDLTFTFAKSGSLTVPVPVDAGATTGPVEAGASSGSGGHGGGH
ncbi:hypothetical protein P0W64_20915 [Tsukamurella sp. 8F]|uniref:hypothetical protein n=1 Tax=unclassified Tsukamurella TaxID=2633480 RepID=UPI0023B96BDE|nr:MULTISPECIES: hypothetical protein [unclassified Tsukamurella]MDF0532190.1 hypothetical protein [Tsukamurella sp. 8J]MDF0589247.1 hypothetical protein [Tsukamurella sp. 8F]